MGKKIARVILFSLLTTGRLLSAEELIRRTCNEARFFPGPWQDIIRREIAIQNAFDLIASRAGTGKTTNCVVEWPEENGRPLNGLRRAMFDIQWNRTVIVGGVPTKEFHQEGIRIEYFWEMSNGVISRKIDGFVVCRSAQACERLGLNKQIP